MTVDTRPRVTWVDSGAGDVERGWVERETPANNRREVFACLTDAGAAALEVARPSYLRVLRETLSRHLDEDEREELARMTHKLLAGLSTSAERTTR
jgi:DNA-binding MarR family transcriptional regulator